MDKSKSPFVELNLDIIKAAIIGDPHITPDDGQKALAYIRRYILKCEQELAALDLATEVLAKRVREG